MYGNAHVIKLQSDNILRMACLWHELGHSIRDVSEEYDRGLDYFGANSADEEGLAVYHLPWEHLLSDPQGARIEKSTMPSGLPRQISFDPLDELI